MSTRVHCSESIKKQEDIYRLREEIQRLKAQVRRQERKITEGYFGSSTPSSKKPLKENSNTNDKQKKRGGAKAGHKGNGRGSFSEEQADRVESVKATCNCPKCDDEKRNNQNNEQRGKPFRHTENSKYF